MVCDVGGIIKGNGAEEEGAGEQQLLKKGPWTAEEDAVLAAWVEKQGEGKWGRLQRLSGLARCGKSCRLRWTNHLRPFLKKGPLSPFEQRLLISLHRRLGNKWSRIAAQLPGRTDNELKNFWNTRAKKLKRAGLPLYPPNAHDNALLYTNNGIPTPARASATVLQGERANFDANMAQNTLSSKQPIFSLQLPKAHDMPLILEDRKLQSSHGLLYSSSTEQGSLPFDLEYPCSINNASPSKSFSDDSLLVLNQPSPTHLATPTKSLINCYYPQQMDNTSNQSTNYPNLDSLELVNSTPCLDISEIQVPRIIYADDEGKRGIKNNNLTNNNGMICISNINDNIAFNNNNDSATIVSFNTNTNHAMNNNVCKPLAMLIAKMDPSKTKLADDFDIDTSLNDEFLDLASKDDLHYLLNSHVIQSTKNRLNFPNEGHNGCFLSSIHHTIEQT